MSLAGPNCWPPMLAKFVAALTASAAFRAMVGLHETASDEEVQEFIFGNRVTHARSGHAWTREELADLRHYAAVYDDPDAPYGKHRDPLANACFRPHGVTVISLHRLIVDAELLAEPDGLLHTTDEHDDQWREIVGDVLSETLEWLIENGGPKVQNVEVENVTTTRASKQSTQGCWQSAWLVWPWHED